MSAIELAIVSGLIAFLAKIGFDIRIEHQARRAAALAGEMRAYLRLSQPEKTASGIKVIASLTFEERQKCLTGIFSLPSGHPVFDQVADKIGILTPQAAQGVSEAYNIFTSVRLALTLIGSETFLHVPDRLQGVYMTTMADMFLQEVEGMKKTVTLLDDISRQGWFSYLAGRNPSSA